MHEIYWRALELRGVKQARLKIAELYGNGINIFLFSIILAAESSAYATLELSLLPAPQIVDSHLFFSAREFENE